MARARVLTGVAEPVAFIVRAVLWSLALFGFLRISFVEQAIVLALLRTQATIVQWYVAAAANTISITPSCGASDVMAMCLGVILAYPATWRRRLAGAAGGLGIIIGLNILRLATLATVVSRWPESFTVVHVIVWPVLLIAATAVYVGRWMLASHQPSVLPSGGGASRPRVRRFAWIAGGLLALHLAVAPVDPDQPDVDNRRSLDRSNGATRAHDRRLQRTGEWNAADDDARRVSDHAGMSVDAHPAAVPRRHPQSAARTHATACGAGGRGADLFCVGCDARARAGSARGADWVSVVRGARVLSDRHSLGDRRAGLPAKSRRAADWSGRVGSVRRRGVHRRHRGGVRRIPDHAAHCGTRRRHSPVASERVDAIGDSRRPAGCPGTGARVSDRPARVRCGLPGVRGRDSGE